ncbi:urea ABC transporter, permease protein UrtC [compost metagenome]
MTPLETTSAKPQSWWWGAIFLSVVALLFAPSLIDLATQFDITAIFVFGILAMSMSFLWGAAGMLSFGQTIFFGLGGYGYTVLTMNGFSGLVSLSAAILLGATFAALLGYFMIYGRISDIFLSVITLVVTLIFEKLIRTTSGPENVIGSVRLNGTNGIPGIPGLTLPFTGGEPLSIEGVFWLTGGLLLFCYVVLRLVLASRFGRILVGIRENERRMELLGYDTRFYRLSAFVIAGAAAALSGVLFALWGSFVGPEMFNLNQAAQIVIWVIVGGRSTLIGPVVGVALVQYLTNWLGTAGLGQVSTVLGLVLIGFVLLFPDGLIPALDRALGKIIARRATRSVKEGQANAN